MNSDSTSSEEAGSFGATDKGGLHPGSSGLGLGGLGGLEELARKLVAGVPGVVGAARDDLARHFHLLLESQIARLNLCSRSEFQAQAKVLERTQLRLADLEARAVVLEQRLSRSGE